MPRGYNRYDFVVDNGNFNPYQSMTEMLVPFQAYKEVFDKEQERMLDYGKKASVFKYLADRLPEDSQAARIYQGYMKDFEEEAKDFTKNGRTALNSRNLLDLWRRYDNEIGQLELAEKNRQKEFDKRMANKDTSMLYATDVLDIDDFIGNNSPNLYSVSGNALYTKGAALGKAISDREVTSGDNGSVLGNYYRNWKETQGVRNSDIREFINRPDVQEELQRYMKAEGLDNLTGANRERAEQQLLSGFYTGIEYSEKNNLHRDLGVMSASEKAQDVRSEKNLALTASASNMKWDEKSKSYVYDEDLAKKKQQYALGDGTPGGPTYNPDEWELKPDGKGGFTYVRKQQPKEEKNNIVLNDPVSYDEDGNRRAVASKDNKNLGKPISYEEAASDERFAQQVTAHHPGYEDCYDYSIASLGGKDILIIMPNKRKLAERQNKSKANPSTPAQAVDPSKNNQLN